MRIRRPALLLFLSALALHSHPTRTSAASEWMQRIAFQDSMVNLEIAREHLQTSPPTGVAPLQTAGGSIWYGRIVRRLPGHAIEDESNFLRFAVEYREGAAVRAWGMPTSSGGGLTEVPLYSYPPLSGSRSLLLSIGAGWSGGPTGGKTPRRDLARVILESEMDSAATPSYSVQAVFGKVGTMEIGRGRHLALLFDGNRDGRFSKDLFDGVFVDLNNDRHFDVDLGSDEFAPFRVPFELGESIYEAASIDPNGAQALVRRVGPAPSFRSAHLGEQAPEFSWPSTTGQEQSLRDFRGAPAVLFFWTSWCPACRAQAVGVDDLMDRYPSAGLKIIGINLESDLTGAKPFLATYGATWTNWFTEREAWESGIARRYGVRGPGTLCLVDAKGALVIQTSQIAEVEKGVRNLLQLPPGAGAGSPVGLSPR